MDAIRIARGTTGRETIVKIFGSYHGHHDGVMVSIGVEYDQIGDHENLASACPTARASRRPSWTSRSRSRSTTRARWSAASSA